MDAPGAREEVVRVLHLDSGREWRGGQTQLLHLVDGSDDVVLLPRDAPLWGALSRPLPYGLLSLHRAIACTRPDLLAAHTSRAHQLALLQCSVPVIVHRRVDFPPRRLSRLKYAAATGFVAVSEAVSTVLQRSGLPASRIRVVHDGVHPPEGNPIPRPAGPLLLAVGALVPHKDHRTLIRAAAIGGFRVWIAGEGPLRAPLERLIAELRAPVTLLGERSDVPDLLATADLFCHPSALEGLGQVVIEARAMGCRIVACESGGVPEIAGPHATLCAPSDPFALASAIRVALSRPAPQPDLPPELSARSLRQRTFAAYSQLIGI